VQSNQHKRVESARQWVSRLRCAARRQLRALGCARRAGARASAQGSVRRWGQHDRWERVRHGRPLGTSSRRWRTCGETAGTAGRRAVGSPPAPAASVQADATQRAAGVVSFGCAQGGVVSARAKLSTRWGCGQRGNVLPTVALRTVRVSVMLVHRPDARTLAKAWGRGVQPRLQGSWQRTGGRTRLQDTQPASRIPTSGCLSALSLLFAPNICMLAYTHVHTIYICTYLYIHPCMNTNMHTYIHTYIHAYIHTSILTYIHTYIHLYLYTCVHTHTYIPTSMYISA